MAKNNWERIQLEDTARTDEDMDGPSQKIERLINIKKLKKSVAKTELILIETYKEIDIINKNTKSIIDKLKQKIARNEDALKNILQEIHNTIEKEPAIQELKRKRRNIFWWCFGITIVIASSFLVWMYTPLDFWEKILLYISKDSKNIKILGSYF